MSQPIQLSDHFDFRRLIQFTLPSMGMMVFTSIYGVVDGFFVSNFAGSTPFAAINLIMPFLMIFSAVGFMVGTGGTALVSMRFGEGKQKKAEETFSLLVYFVIAAGLVMTVVGEVFLKDVALALGASKEMQLLPYCITYGRIIMACLVPFMLQNMFQSFLIAAEKPQLGLALTVASGVTNMILDAVLVGALNLGVTGAASATLVSQVIGGMIPLIYFILPNSSKLHLCKCPMDLAAIGRACFNGSSEFLTNISMSVVNMLYNFQLLKLAGTNGVTAYGVIMYVCFIFVAIFVGYAIGVAPIIGYNYGADNHEELQNVFKKSLQFISIFAVLMFAAAMLLAGPLSKIYVGYDEDIYALTVHAFKIYSISFLVMGFNIFGSSFFTALNNGLVSGAISFMRTLVFQIIMVLLLPVLLGLDGIWSSIIFAELLSLIVTVFFWIRMRGRYHYI